MGGKDRYRIDELIAFPTLEPNMRHVVVEGSRDVQLYGSLLAGSKLPVQFWCIDQIEVASEIVEKHAQRIDNHGRVIALSYELIRKRPQITSHVKCLVDGEFDYVLGRLGACELLEYLGATSPEALTLDPTVIDRFRLHALKPNAPSAAEIIRMCSQLLRTLLVFRAVNHQQGWGLKWPKKLRPRLVGEELEIDSDAFIDQYVRSGPELVSREEFVERARVLDQVANRLHLQESARGHDIGAVIGAAIRPHLRDDHQDYAKSEVCMSALMMCLESKSLLRLPAIARVAQFVELV